MRYYVCLRHYGDERTVETASCVERFTEGTELMGAAEVQL